MNPSPCNIKNRMVGALRKRIYLSETFYVTERERDILLAICSGEHRKLTAKRLGISPKTIAGHLQYLSRRTGKFKNVSQLALWSITTTLFTQAELDQIFSSLNSPLGKACVKQISRSAGEITPRVDLSSQPTASVEDKPSCGGSGETNPLKAPQPGQLATIWDRYGGAYIRGREFEHDAGSLSGTNPQVDSRNEKTNKSRYSGPARKERVPSSDENENGNS